MSIYLKSNEGLSYRNLSFLSLGGSQLRLHNAGRLRVGNVLGLLPFRPAVLEPNFDLIGNMSVNITVKSSARLGEVNFTCCWVTWRLVAMSALSAEERYFFVSKLFSSSNICLPVKVVRIFFLLELEFSSSFPSVSISESFFLLLLLPWNLDGPETFDSGK